MTTTDTPAAEARETLDLDAIEKRADAATSGPWYQGRDSVRYESSFEAWTRRDADAPESFDLFPVAGEAADAEFIAHARTDVPALIARIRELEAATSVIPADTRPYETQSAALDALPVHTLVSYRDHDGELHTLEKTPGWRSAGDSAWWETIARSSVTTYNLAHNEVDYTIVRMGDGS